MCRTDIRLAALVTRDLPTSVERRMLVARSVPKYPDPPQQVSQPGRVTRKYEIHVVTPMFGGGVRPGVNDPHMVRGSAVRGHLRFWWRATRGACFSLSDLRKREEEIWGSTSSPAKVTVRVSNVSKVKLGPWARFQTRYDGKRSSLPTPVNPNYPVYALFPFQKDPPEVVQGSFQLTLEWPEREDIDKDVEAALWAWVNFGGLGSRTRRGCGSLYLASMAPDMKVIDAVGGLQKWYTECCSRYGIALDGEVRDWPTLPATLLFKPEKKAPLEAWNIAVQTLSEFRQGTGIGRSSGKGRSRFGRSRWPEADSIRRLLRQALPAHARSTTGSVDAFPRAEFGLPIIFHFKDEPKKGTHVSQRSQHDPIQSQLLPKGGSGRMASPLIVKALAINKSTAVPLIMRLRTRPLEGALLKPDSPGNSKTSEVIEISDRMIRPEKPGHLDWPLARWWTGSGSALDAFIRFAIESEGYR